MLTMLAISRLWEQRPYDCESDYVDSVDKNHSGVARKHDATSNSCGAQCVASIVTERAVGELFEVGDSQVTPVNVRSSNGIPRCSAATVT